MTPEQAAHLAKLVKDGVLTAEEVAAIQESDAKHRESLEQAKPETK